MVSIKRKMYKRGSSFETTIPMSLLFHLNLEKKHNVVFVYDNDLKKWFIEFEESTINQKDRKKSKK